MIHEIVRFVDSLDSGFARFVESPDLWICLIGGFIQFAEVSFFTDVYYPSRWMGLMEGNVKNSYRGKNSLKNGRGHVNGRVHMAEIAANRKCCYFVVVLPCQAMR